MNKNTTNKRKGLVLVIFGLMFFVFVALLLLKDRIKPQTGSFIPKTDIAPNPTSPNPYTKIEIKSEDLGNGWMRWNVGKRAYDYKPFVLYYPKSWSIIATTSLKDPRYYFLITLQKQDYSMEIGQREAGYGTCIYQGDIRSQESGMFYPFALINEMNKGSVIWRLSKPETVNDDLISYSVCSSYIDSQGKIDYKQVTEIGSISLEGKTKNDNLLKEAEEILQKIEITY